MANQLTASSDFTEMLAIHAALKAALKSRQFENNAPLKAAANKLCKSLESDKSVYGKQVKMLKQMEGGATVADLGRKLKISRRTVFRYLNYFEEAGIDITLDGSKYTVSKSVLKSLQV